MKTTVLAAASLFTLAQLMASTPLHACTGPEVVETQLFSSAAPVGGVWWVAGANFHEAGDTVHLTGLDGVADVDVAVVSVGPGYGLALAVPDVVAGTRYAPGDDISLDVVWSDEQALEVVDGPVDNTGDVPTVELRVDKREVRQGYSTVAVSPIGGECEQATGWWSHTYGEGAFAVIDGLPEGVVLDMTVRPRGEEAFAPVTSANQFIFDADVVTAVDDRLVPPPGADTEFTVHARYRRMADGVAGPVLSVDVSIDPAQTKRTEFVGCTSAGMAPPWALAVALLALRRRRRGAGR